MKNYKPLKIAILTINFLLLMSSTFSVAQSKIKGNRDVKTEQTNVPAFKTLSIADGLEVVFIKSPYPSVTIEADSNLHSAIQFQVNDSVLNFQVTKSIRSAKELKAIIRYTDVLNTIVLGGEVDAEAENTIQLPKLNLTLNNDAKIEADIVSDEFHFQNNNDSNLKLFTNCILKIESKSARLDVRAKSNNIIDINTEKLHINSQDSAEIVVEGFAYELELSSTGTSGIEGKNLLTNIAKVNVTEKSKIEVNVTESITIDASGSGKIELFGESKIIIEQLLNEVTLKKSEL